MSFFAVMWSVRTSYGYSVLWDKIRSTRDLVISESPGVESWNRMRGSLSSGHLDEQVG